MSLSRNATGREFQRDGIDALGCYKLKARSSAIARGYATRLSVEILQLQNISFVKACNQQITLKYIGSYISLPVSGPLSHRF